MLPADATSPAATFAYLTVLEHEEHGFFGGYLIVCAAGRPLEFHCSAPVQPSRAQEILYGPTLRPYVLGQQIAGGLLANAKLRPRLILTDQPEVLMIRSRVEQPVVLLRAAVVAVSPTDAADPLTASSQRHFCFANYHCEIPVGYQRDAEEVRRRMETLSASVELGEPFERIHLAIREAQRIGESEPANDARVA
jgi:hypothetical protein